MAVAGVAFSALLGLGAAGAAHAVETDDFSLVTPVNNNQGGNSQGGNNNNQQ